MAARNELRLLTIADVDDTLDDLFPGTGAVGRAWESWRAQRTLFDAVVVTAQGA
jgi:hypothetical protein